MKVDKQYECIIQEALSHSMGDALREPLANDSTTDILVNADGSVWIDQIGRGLYKASYKFDKSHVESVIRLLADHCGQPITAKDPILSATLPGSGERVAGTIPPITFAPTLAIRKPPKHTFEINDFGENGCIDYNFNSQTTDECSSYKDVIMNQIKNKNNILIAGSTGSGKTSLLSAILSTPSFANDRLVVIEDQQEIDVKSENHVRLLSSRTVDVRELVRLSLRYRPDRLIVGEIRDSAAATEMIRAMNSGHDGSICTIHANSAEDALAVFGDVWQIPRRAVERVVDCVIFMQRGPGKKPVISEVLTNI